MRDTVDEAATNPILTTGELNLEAAARWLAIGRQLKCECDGLTLASLCRHYLAEEKPEVRRTTLRTEVRTRSDALAVISLLERREDAELASHLLQCLHMYLTAA